MNTDPWHTNKTPNNTSSLQLEFEDNFINNYLEVSCSTVLPDSEQYLESLEKKLKKLKRDSNILEQLSQKREEVLGRLINSSIDIDRSNVELDVPLSGDSTVNDIYRHLNPVQPITLGETYPIVKYDQLQEEKDADSDPNLDNTSETASR